MGKVLSPDYLASHRLPEKGAHFAAAQFIISTFETHPELRHVVQSMVYGTTAVGRADVRSDVDIFTTYYALTEEKQELVKAIIETVYRQAQEKYDVFVEARTMSEQDLFEYEFENGGEGSTGPYPVDPMYAMHLVQVQKSGLGVSWGNPASVFEGMAFDPERASSPEQKVSIGWHAVRYAEGKLSYFSELSDRADDSDVDYDAYQRLLELPKAMGRKVVTALRELLDTLDVGGDVTDKKVMQAALATAAIRSGEQLLPAAQSRLVLLDQAYTDILNRYVAGKITLAEYEKWLVGHYSGAIQDGRLVAERWAKITREHAERRSEQYAIFEEEITGTRSYYD